MSTTVATAPPLVSQDLLNAVNPKKSAAAEGSVQADTDKFMTLLVTQLKNQDPLNPLDNAQITSQLAQLSTVTGINKLNDTLETLKGSYQSSEALQATNMIPRRAGRRQLRQPQQEPGHPGRRIGDPGRHGAG
jgi:flagellar basal-body rod modification protein FlgD